MELTIDEGRVYGARYYTVDPTINWGDADYSWNFKNPWKEMEAWCEQTFGPTGFIWGESVPQNHRWYVNNAKFWFREKKDLEWFILKWQ